MCGRAVAFAVFTRKNAQEVCFKHLALFCRVDGSVLHVLVCCPHSGEALYRAVAIKRVAASAMLGVLLAVLVIVCVRDGVAGGQHGRTFAEHSDIEHFCQQ